MASFRASAQAKLLPQDARYRRSICRKPEGPMQALPVDLAMPLPLAIAVVLGTIGVLVYVIDALERRGRRSVRRERVLLAERVLLFLDGSLQAGALRRA